MRIVDLFSGAGGLTFGFYYRVKNGGFVRNRKNSFVFANEYDKHAARAFSKNYPDIQMLNCDIKTITEEQIKELIGDDPVDIIIGGPPCQSLVQSEKEDLTTRRSCTQSICDSCQ